MPLACAAPTLPWLVPNLYSHIQKDPDPNVGVTENKAYARSLLVWLRSANSKAYGSPWVQVPRHDGIEIQETVLRTLIPLVQVPTYDGMKIPKAVIGMASVTSCLYIWVLGCSGYG